MKKFKPTTTFYKQGAKTLAQKYYTSEEIFFQEKEKIFVKSWNCVGRTEKLKNAGDYIICSIADESIIITKDSNGKLRAFYNVCRHRGTRICMADGGNLGKFIQCDYHGWTYGNDGHLINAPHMQEVKGFDKTKYGLNSVALAEWEGFLFVNISTKPKPFNKEWSALIGRLSRYNLSNLKVGHKVVYDIKGKYSVLSKNTFKKFFF